MNLQQTQRLALILLHAHHPGRCPITGDPYSRDELSAFGEPYVYDLKHESYEGTEYLMARVVAAGIARHEVEVSISPDGRPWLWSHLTLAPEDCDCECGPIVAGHGSHRGCPRHGRGVRELECYREIANIGFELVDRDSSVTPGRKVPDWAFVVREGGPHRDVLSEWRAERAMGAAA